MIRVVKQWQSEVSMIVSLPPKTLPSFKDDGPTETIMGPKWHVVVLANAVQIGCPLPTSDRRIAPGAKSWRSGYNMLTQCDNGASIN